MVTHLQTERLILRDFVDADFARLIELDNDPEVMRFISDEQPRGAEMVRTFLDSCIASQASKLGFGFWAADHRESGEFVGWFHFRPDRELPKEMEVGYRLKRAAWGLGLATEGALALVQKGFDEQDVRSVTGRTMRANIASANVLRKCGLVLVCEHLEERFPGEDKQALLLRRVR